MAERLLLRGGSVVSMDPKVGDIPKGDVLIEGDKIAQVAPNIQADAQVIDVTGDVVMSPRWELLGPLEAADGMLMFGVSTALIFAVVPEERRYRNVGDQAK